MRKDARDPAAPEQGASRGARQASEHPCDGEENSAVGSADVSLACDPETFNCFVGFISVRSLRDEQLVSALGRREGCGRRRVCGGEDEASAYLFAESDI